MISLLTVFLSRLHSGPDPFSRIGDRDKEDDNDKLDDIDEVDVVDEIDNVDKIEDVDDIAI